VPPSISWFRRRSDCRKPAPGAACRRQAAWLEVAAEDHRSRRQRHQGPGWRPGLDRLLKGVAHLTSTSPRERHRLGRSLRISSACSRSFTARSGTVPHQQGLDTSTPPARRCSRCSESSPNSSGPSCRNASSRPGAGQAQGKSWAAPRGPEQRRAVRIAKATGKASQDCRGVPDRGWDGAADRFMRPRINARPFPARRRVPVSPAPKRDDSNLACWPVCAGAGRQRR